MDKKIYAVTWTNHIVGQVGNEDIKCFDDRETAIAFANLMKNEYSYVNMFEDYVSD